MSDTETATADPAAAEFYMGFESLGANCEFGLLQRHFGAEPLGLLRWPAITPQGLITSLSHDFNELNDIANLSLIPGPNEDWDVQTPNFSLHLYAKIGSVDEGELLKTAHRRIQFMRRSILETLEETEKIFVFKEWQFRMTDDEITGMFQAVRRHNNANRFLAVRLAHDPAQAGTVAELQPGLWLGHVELDAKVSARDNVPVRSWDRICRLIG